MGLLAARISRSAVDEIEDESGMSGGLVADNLTDMIRRRNPFLRELFASFLKLGGRDKRKRWTSMSWACATWSIC